MADTPKADANTTDAPKTPGSPLGGTPATPGSLGAGSIGSGSDTLSAANISARVLAFCALSSTQKCRGVNSSAGVFPSIPCKKGLTSGIASFVGTD